MRKFQDTFETRKGSFITAFFSLCKCNYKFRGDINNPNIFLCILLYKICFCCCCYCSCFRLGFLRWASQEFVGVTHMYVSVSGKKKCSFFWKLAMLCVLFTFILRFTFLLYHRRVKALMIWILMILGVLQESLIKIWLVDK